MKTRIWCEFAQPVDVCKDYILELFKKNDVTLNYRLEYGKDDKNLYDMIGKYNENGIPISIWATLSDDMGYWVNESNAYEFYEYIKKIIDRIEKQGLKISGICIDMETPLGDARKIIAPKNKLEPFTACAKILTVNLNKLRYNNSSKVLAETADYIRKKGLESYAACIRHSYYDLRFNTEIVQNALEIPVFKIPWDKYNLMYYATMIRNEMKKYKKVNVDYLIYHQVSYLNKVLGDKLAVSIGVTNVGKLGNESYYCCMEEFEKDMGILKECGVKDFSLFSLDGIMEEKKLENFLERMKKAKPIKPQTCSRVHRNETLLGVLMNMGKLYYNLRR